MARAWSVKPVAYLEQGRRQHQERALIEEVVLRLEFADGTVQELLATPGQERELAAGWTLTMGLLSCSEPPPACQYDAIHRTVRLDLPGGGSGAQGPRASGGGRLGPVGLGGADRQGAMALDCAIALPRVMVRHQGLFRTTGASHAAALFDAAGELLALAEDVGRHNALDKAIGELWLSGQLRQAFAVALSGRASMEMVRKATRANLALIVGVSAPTAQAVAEARRARITLLGFARGDAATLYTPSWHVAQGSSSDGPRALTGPPPLGC